tara:strand:- start:4829 stop:6088 length:1260 start_codon:yes stop_codon:yes gene_type:complete
MYALIDCNNFYVSCERVFNPRLENKPVIVLSNNDGCVIARSDEVKSMGVKMGEPAFKIKDTIYKNNIITFSTNFALYGNMSNRVINTISSFSCDMEIYSIDEVFINLSIFNEKDLLSLSLEIKNKIKKWTGIPVSIGIAKTKTLAKAANYIAKQNKSVGVCLINSSNRLSFLNQIPISKVWGVGSKRDHFLKINGIKTARDLSVVDLFWIRKHMTITGEKTVQELRGISCMPLELLSSSKKSICTSRTFGKMIDNDKELINSIATYVARCAEKLRLQKSYANVAHIFISSNSFRKDLPQYTQSKVIKFPSPLSDTGEMLVCIIPVVKKIFKSGYLYKKAGVVLSGIIADSIVQGNLFEDYYNIKNRSVLLKTIDSINKKMGRDTIRYAIQDYNKNLILKQQNLSQCYTTKWSDLLSVKL